MAPRKRLKRGENLRMPKERSISVLCKGDKHLIRNTKNQLKLYPHVYLERINLNKAVCLKQQQHEEVTMAKNVDNPSDGESIEEENSNLQIHASNKNESKVKFLKGVVKIHEMITLRTDPIQQQLVREFQFSKQFYGNIHNGPVGLLNVSGCVQLNDQAREEGFYQGPLRQSSGSIGYAGTEILHSPTKKQKSETVEEENNACQIQLEKDSFEIVVTDKSLVNDQAIDDGFYQGALTQLYKSIGYADTETLHSPTDKQRSEIVDDENNVGQIQVEKDNFEKVYTDELLLNDQAREEGFYQGPFRQSSGSIGYTDTEILHSPTKKQKSETVEEENNASQIQLEKDSFEIVDTDESLVNDQAIGDGFHQGALTQLCKSIGYADTETLQSPTDKQRSEENNVGQIQVEKGSFEKVYTDELLLNGQAREEGFYQGTLPQSSESIGYAYTETLHFPIKTQNSEIVDKENNSCQIQLGKDSFGTDDTDASLNMNSYAQLNDQAREGDFQQENLQKSQKNLHTPTKKIESKIFNRTIDSHPAEESSQNGNILETPIKYRFSDSETNQDIFEDPEFSEDEYRPDEDDISSSSESYEMSDFERGERKNILFRQDVKKKLFVEDYTEDKNINETSLSTEDSSSSSTCLDKSESFKKSLSNSSKSKVAATMHLNASSVKMRAVLPLHKGTYFGRYQPPENPNEDASPKEYGGIILTKKDSYNRHICDFNVEREFYGTLKREGFTCMLEMHCCVQVGTYFAGTELKVPGLKLLYVTGLTLTDPSKDNNKMPLHLQKFTRTKQHACCFCGKLNTSLKRHLLTQHSTEEDVKKLLNSKPKSKEQLTLMTKLRILGDGKYNKIVDQWDPSLRIVVKNPTKKCVSEHVYCSCCGGSYSKRNFARHNRKCTGRPPNHERVTPRNKENIPNNNGVEKLLENLRLDEVGNTVRNDEVLQTMAIHYVDSVQELGHRQQNVRQNLRKLARLSLKAQELDPSISCFRDCLVPGKYDTLMQGIRELCRMDYGIQTEGQPYKALAYGPAISNTINAVLIREMKCRKQSDPILEELNQVKRIHELDFKNQITRRALIMSRLKKMNKSYSLPKIDDIKKFADYILELANTSYDNLSKNGFDFQDWKQLGESLLCQIIIFNRRRIGEASRITIENFNNRQKVAQDDYKCLSRLQIILAKKYSVMYITGKRVRPLPILLDATQEKHIKTFLAYRSQACVTEQNKFLFGYPAKDGHMNASLLMRKYSVMCDADQPDLLRGTMLRRQVATLSQFLSLSENDIQQLSDFMGHDINVHRNHYRQPSLTLDITKMGRFFSVIGDANLEKYKGKSIDELEPFIPPERFDEDDMYDDEELVNELAMQCNHPELSINFEHSAECTDETNEETTASAVTAGKSSQALETLEENIEEQIETTLNEEAIFHPPCDQTEISVSPSTLNSPNAQGKNQQQKRKIKSVTPKKQTVNELLYLCHKQGSPKIYRRRNTVSRVAWSKEEKLFMKAMFGKYFNPKCSLPSKTLLRKVLDRHPSKLDPSRTPDNMYAYIQNQRKKT